MNETIRPLLFCLALIPAAGLAQTVPLAQDSWVIPGSAANFGNTTTLSAGGTNSTSALVQFDLTALPAGTIASNISKAVLTLFVNKVDAVGAVNISVANGGWTELGVTGNNTPAAGASVASAISVSTSGAYLYVDATAAVQSWLNGTTNSGFLISPNDGIVFHSTARRAPPQAIPQPLTLPSPPRERPDQQEQRAQRGPPDPQV